VNLVCALSVFRVVESRHPDFNVGIHVVGHFGWRTRTVVNGDNPEGGLWLDKLYIVPDLNGLPLSLSLGALGMPG
jgi:NADPH-dependent curcumin reductase CurA